MAQARKKPVKVAKAPSRLTHHLKESAFLLSILVAVYLVACLFTYDPNDPGPFNTTNSDHVQNAGRVLGAWIADAFLGLMGYIAYLLPLITIYAGWRVWTKQPAASETGAIEVLAIITGLALFVLSSTGLAYMHLWPEAVWWQSRAVPVLVSLSVVFISLFVSSFLKIFFSFFKLPLVHFSNTEGNIYPVIIR